MKNILVLVSGGSSDGAMSAAAFSLAQPLDAHLEFFHVQVDPREAALWQPHAEFARGPAMREIFQRLEAECVMRTAVARHNFVQFCELHRITITERPCFDIGVSASWREEIGDADRRLMFCARHYDLVIMGRPTGPNGLPPNFLETMLLGCGRPLLIAPRLPSNALLGTIMVCWKETANAARALGAAMPLLAKAERVVLAGVEEKDAGLADGLADLSRQLEWHGVSARLEFVPSGGGPPGEALMAMARSHEASLLVMGGYGHSHTRETIFGGFTQSVLEAADITAFLMH